MQKDIMIENQGFAGINPLVCGEQKCEPQHSFGPARREYYLLHYVISGKGVFYTDRGSYTVGQDEIFVVRPMENTLYTADSKNPWYYCWVGFECQMPLDHILTPDILPAQGCGHIFRAMASCDREAGREWYICGKICELLSQLSGKGQQSQDRTRQYVGMARNYIESNYVQELKVENLASSLGLDRSYFSQIFKRHTGKSPQQYIVDFRLGKAAELLSVQNLSPGEAARQVGYSDIFNFSRMFRRRYGVPPSRYSR